MGEDRNMFMVSRMQRINKVKGAAAEEEELGGMPFIAGTMLSMAPVDRTLPYILFPDAMVSCNWESRVLLHNPFYALLRPIVPDFHFK